MSKIYGLMFFLFFFSAHADEKKLITEFEYGTFETSLENLEEGDRVISKNDRPLQQTDQIQAKLGTKFGIRYWLPRAGFEGNPELHLIYIFPTMINPQTGEFSNKIELLQKDSEIGIPHMMAFEFSQNYELVSGEYEFYIFYNNQLLLKKVFNVKAN